MKCRDAIEQNGLAVVPQEFVIAVDAAIAAFESCCYEMVLPDNFVKAMEVLQSERDAIKSYE